MKLKTWHQTLIMVVIMVAVEGTVDLFGLIGLIVIIPFLGIAWILDKVLKTNELK